MRIKVNFVVTRGLISLFLFMSAATFASQQPVAKTHHKSTKKTTKQVQATALQPSVPSGPLQALPLDQIPSAAPLVNYKNNQLTITSRNSTLGDILRAVQTQTGAVIEMPSNSTERVVGYFGPGPARDVLASLLNGSHFNYVLLGAAGNSSVLDRVILITKSGPDEVTPTAQANASGQSGVPQPVAGMGGPGMPQDADPGADSGEEAQDETTTDDSANGAAPEDAAAQQQQGAPPAMKSPEQLLQELQRQQMIQQQQQNGGAGAPQGFPAPQPVPFQQSPEQ
ncbi:MAG: hypothetical protein JWO91_1503 [Acidobacteriaceae bacterium]|jgi:hypothetical protein|nr:hypothetical protein [Acidobacteriaceae bacterium]